MFSATYLGTDQLAPVATDDSAPEESSPGTDARALLNLRPTMRHDRLAITRHVTRETTTDKAPPDGSGYTPPADLLPAADQGPSDLPWYKNWKIMVPVGLGAAGLVGVGLWLTR